MGITGGVDNLHWLFTGTFVATVAAMPLFGWIAFAGGAPAHPVLGVRLLRREPGAVRAGPAACAGRRLAGARSYVWLSVFNMIAILARLERVGRPCFRRRGQSACSRGRGRGQCGGWPALGVALVGVIGHAGLLLLSAALLGGAGIAAAGANAGAMPTRWRRTRRAWPGTPAGRQSIRGPGRRALRSPYMLASRCSWSPAGQRQHLPLYIGAGAAGRGGVPGQGGADAGVRLIDATAQALAIVSQLFITGRIAQRLGIGVLLVGAPLLVGAGLPGWRWPPASACSSR